MNLTLGATGVFSALRALLMPGQWGMFAGFVCMTLPLTMPWLAVRYSRKVEALSPVP